MTQIYDLKGSERSRYVNPAAQDQVLLDENLLENTYGSPLFVREHSKAMLHMAIWNDALFLSSLKVMDYSLLVGINTETSEIVVGIIGKYWPGRSRYVAPCDHFLQISCASTRGINNWRPG